MNSKQIECFLEVGKLLNFTKAAENLYLTQPAVSRYISALEKELGAQLLIRESSRKISLSPEGKAYYNLFLRQVNELANTRKLLDNEVTELRLGYNVGWNISAFLPDVIAKCRQRLPDFRITFQCLSFQGLITALRKHRLDAILTIESYLEQVDGLECCRFAAAQRAIVYSERLRDSREITSPTDFYCYDFFIADDPRIVEICENAENLFRPYQFIPRFVTVPNMETVYAYVENGLGVALLDSWCQNINSPGIRHMYLSEYLPVALGWRKHSTDPTVPVLLEELTRHFQT